MRRFLVSDDELQVFTELMNEGERLVFKEGVHRDENKGLVMPFAITFSYLPGGGYIEHESIEFYTKEALFNDPPQQTKYVVREHPPANTIRTLIISPGSGMERGIWVNVETLGYTLEGGQGDDPREPWARFTIEDEQFLRMAFGYTVDTGSRTPNETGTYIVLRSTSDHPLVAMTVMEVNGRSITITEVGEITLNLGPDVDGQAGPLLKAFFRKVKWAEGDLIKPRRIVA